MRNAPLKIGVKGLIHLRNSLTARYVAALGTVALITMIGQLLIQGTLSHQSNFRELVSTAFRLNTTSQTLSSAILKLQLEQANKPIKKMEDHLDPIIQNLESDYNRLKQIVEKVGNQDLKNDSFRAFFSHIDLQITDLIKTSKNLPSLKEDKYFKYSLSKEQEFRTSVSMLIGRFEESASKQGNQLKQTELVLALILFSVLILQGLLVFRPAVSKVGETLIELKNSEARKGAIHESSLDAIITMDDLGRIQDFNRAAEETFGYQRLDVLGKPLTDLLLSKKFRTTFKSDIDRYIQFGNKTQLINRRIEIEGVRADGTQVPLEAAVTPTRLGEQWIFSCYFRDITIRKEYEKQLVEARESAITALRIRSEFVTNISHEIRNPLNAILGMNELLSETSVDLNQRRYIDIMRRAGQSILDLINDFLDFSRLEAGRVEIERIRFPLLEVAERSIDIVSSRAEEKNLDLILDIDFQLPKDIFGDPKRIQQILVNLLSNAIKFTSRGEVILKVRQANSPLNSKLQVIFEVIDSGIGIPPDKQDRIFESFTQVDASITRKFGGTGLGLSICKQLCLLMGGSISLSSKVGVGSSFIVNLPIEPVDSKIIFDQFKRYSIKKVNIVLFDLNKNYSDTLKRLFEGLDATVIDEASHTLKNHKIDFILAKYEWSSKIDFFNQFSESKIIWISSLRDLSHIISPIEKEKNRVCIPRPIRPIHLAQIVWELKEEIVNKPNQSFQKELLDLEKSRRVLIVEDSEDNREVFKAYLKQTPFKFEFAENGLEGIERFTQGIFDIVFMDIQMPELDGFSATREIRKWEKLHGKRGVPIVALTAYGHKEEIQKCFDAGCTQHLTKPVTKSNFLKTISEIHTAAVELHSSETHQTLL